MHDMFKLLTVLNIVLVLIPTILIDIYGLIKYEWGNQFYIIMIETLAISVFMIGLQIYEFKVMKIIEPSMPMAYSKHELDPNTDQAVMKRIDYDLRNKF